MIFCVNSGWAETIQNVVILILDDANLTIALGKEAYQINGIVGYPGVPGLWDRYLQKRRLYACTIRVLPPIG